MTTAFFFPCFLHLSLRSKCYSFVIKGVVEKTKYLQCKDFNPRFEKKLTMKNKTLWFLRKYKIKLLRILMCSTDFNFPENLEIMSHSFLIN